MNLEAQHYRDHFEVKSKLVDPFAREINYLRLSVTDRCDFRCLYCMSENMQFLPKKDLLTLEELDYMCSTFIKLGVKKLRVTGGEPLVRRDIMKFFERISRHLQTDLLEELTLTTNGSQLRRFSNDLYKMGVRRINVSLDTLNEEKFNKVTRWGRLSQVLDGIQAAQDAGLRVKINTVALKNFNENELFSITDWCSSKNLDITFIEVMPMGELEQEDRKSQYWSLKDLRNKLEENYSLYDLEENTGGPARYVKVKETQQKIGFITPLSHNFCESCNRVRVTCTGDLFMCLGQENNANLRDTIRKYPNNPERLESAIRSAIDNKPKGHDFDYSRTDIKGQMSRHMSHTGG